MLLLKKEVSEMWMLVYSQMERARDAVLEMNVEMTQQVAVREKRVNAFELKIDSDVEDVISLYNPVAVDLRFALAMLKINSNLERIGDFAEGIANFASLEKSPLDTELLGRLRLPEMFEQCLSMLKLAQQALIDEDIDLATSVFPKDNLLDEINRDASKVIATYLVQHPEKALTCLNLVSVFRKLERTGDHIINIAEEIVFFIDAKVLKHNGNTDERNMTKQKD